MADQHIKPHRIGRGRVTLLRAGGLQLTKFGSFERFWSAVWRALLEPAACHLVEHKRASDNALQTRQLAFPYGSQASRKGNHNADHQLQEHVHRRTAGAGKHGRATRR
jgi:hypothetical protein